MHHWLQGEIKLTRRTLAYLAVMPLMTLALMGFACKLYTDVVVNRSEERMCPLWQIARPTSTPASASAQYEAYQKTLDALERHDCNGQPRR